MFIVGTHQEKPELVLVWQHLGLEQVFGFLATQ